MTPIEDAFLRVTTLLDEPGELRDRSKIVEHFDTMIEYARSDAERRAAYDFKAMALNHIDSIGRDPEDVVEVKKVRAFEALKAFEHFIVEGTG